MRLKPLKKRLTKHRLTTRREYREARLAGRQVTQFKDVLYTGPRTKILKEKKPSS